jgi:phosphotransferase system  glucose/maltose/N-acetylglucosamine-specific IIC component
MKYTFNSQAARCIPFHTYRYALYVIAALLSIVLFVTFNFFIREQEIQAREKEFQRQIEQAKQFLNNSHH